ncbi:MAG: phage portal protein [Simkania sp.]|nr:phage portal protein [Simkania sp.]
MTKYKKKSLNVETSFGGGQNCAGMNINALLSSYKSTIYSCAKKTADKVSSATLRLYRTTSGDQTKSLTPNKKKYVQQMRQKYMVSGNENVEEVTSHDSLTALKKPNPYMTGRALISYVQLYLDMSGIAYINHRDNADFYVLPPNVVTPRRGINGLILHWEYGTDKIYPLGQEAGDNQMLVLATENLIYPYNSYPGTSPAMSCFQNLLLQDKIFATLIAAMKPRPAVMLSPRGEFADVGEDEVERLKRRWRAFLSGEDIMYTDQDMAATIMNWKPADLGAIEISERAEENIAQAFSMPLMILRGAENTSLASYKVALKEWVDGAIMPRLLDIQDFLNTQFLSLFEDTENMFFCFDDPSPEMEAEQMAYLVQAVGANILTVDEARAQIGYEPLGDIQVEQNSIVPEIKEIKKYPKAPYIPQKKKIQEICAKHFGIWKDSVINSIEKTFDKLEIKTIPTKFKPMKNWPKDLADDVQPMVEAIVKNSGQKLLVRVGANPDVVNVFNDHAAIFAAEHALRLSQSTLDTTVKSVDEALALTREAIASGLEQGAGIRELTARIKDIFENASTYRAELIAKTESSRAFNEGLRMSAIESDVVKGFIWTCTDAPCPLCEPLDGTELSLDDELPPLHPGCYCVLREIV